RLSLGRIGQTRAVCRTVSEGAFDLFAQPCVVDDDVRNPCGNEALDMPGDKGLATHLQQRFGCLIGKRAHAFAASGGQYHRAHQNVYPAVTWRFSSLSSMRSSGRSVL